MADITFKGQPVHTTGNLPQKGSQAPSFELVGQDLKPMKLDAFQGKKKVLNIFISLDTPVCSKSIHNFNTKAGSMKDVVILDISMDLPFTASRFCKAEGVHATTLSAFRSSFPDDYGVKIIDSPLQGLCARAVVTLDQNNKVLYSELVTEITHEPNYEAALASLS